MARVRISVSMDDELVEWLDAKVGDMEEETRSSLISKACDKMRESDMGVEQKTTEDHLDAAADEIEEARELLEEISSHMQQK